MEGYLRRRYELLFDAKDGERDARSDEEEDDGCGRRPKGVPELIIKQGENTEAQDTLSAGVTMTGSERDDRETSAYIHIRSMANMRKGGETPSTRAHSNSEDTGLESDTLPIPIPQSAALRSTAFSKLPAIEGNSPHIAPSMDDNFNRFDSDSGSADRYLATVSLHSEILSLDEELATEKEIYSTFL